MKRFHKVLNANRMIWRRRDLRKNSTYYEDILWQELRNNKLGVKFKRQYSVMSYVVDFYCAVAKLAIEIDGSVHNQTFNKEYDTYRTNYLRMIGIKEIRFTNNQVLSNLDEVIKQIKSCVLSPEVRREK